MFLPEKNRLWMQISAPEIEKTEKSCYTERESQRKEWWMQWQKMVRHGCGCARWARQTAKSCRNTGRWVRAARR